MKQKYGLLIATWILWFASILIPLLYSALKSIPRRWMTLLLLVTMLLSLAVLFQWVFLRRSERGDRGSRNDGAAAYDSTGASGCAQRRDSLV